VLFLYRECRARPECPQLQAQDNLNLHNNHKPQHKGLHPIRKKINDVPAGKKQSPLEIERADFVEFFLAA
jgi:hypothetical protein